MGKKVGVVIGGIAGILGLGYLINKALVKPPQIQVALTSNPIRTTILVDNNLEVATPRMLNLAKGVHTFKAVAKSPNTLLTYQIDKWLVNGKPAAYDTTELTLNITKPTRISAEYMLAASGVYPIITLP